MDGSARITLPWGGDEERVFRLALKQIRELQDKTGVGPEALYQRLVSGNWFVNDIRETIRLGLIGGGMDEVAASRLVKDNFDDGGILLHKPTAAAIVLTCLMGPPNDPIARGKAEAEREKSKSLSPNTSESLKQ